MEGAALGGPVSHMRRVMSAVGLYRRARAMGLTVRSSVDCLIAACALRHGLTVLHHDRDFGHLAKVSPLRVKQV